MLQGAKTCPLLYSAVSSRADIESAAKKYASILIDQQGPHELRHLLLQLMTLKKIFFSNSFDVV